MRNFISLNLIRVGHNMPSKKSALVLAGFIGSAHREETMHLCRIWEKKFGSTLNHCVSDMWRFMCSGHVP
jgi:hypothetical protein